MYGNKEIGYKGILGDYILGRKLGEGKFSKVRVGTKEGNQYAVKYMLRTNDVLKDNEFLGLMLNEAKIMMEFNHPNIVKLFEFSEMGNIKKPGKEVSVLYLVLELITGGDLFDYVAVSGKFADGLARYYFKQLISALEYMYSKGYTHRDIKAENILMDSKCNLKLADFGFSTGIKGPNKDGKLYSKKGTLTYMAPELHVNFPYSGEKVDLFAAGVLLFTMVAQRPPFKKADRRDALFKMFCQDNDGYWKKVSTNRPADTFSSYFKGLINGMLELDPAKRFTMVDVKAHPWFNEPIPSLEAVQQEIISRRERIEKVREEIAIQAATNKEMKKIEEARNGNINVGDPKTRGILLPTTPTLVEKLEAYEVIVQIMNSR